MSLQKSPITPGLSFYLDLVRGIAAVLVVMQHATKELFGRFAEHPEGSIGLFGKMFYLGTGFGREAVLGFFVMSGLLIGPKFLPPPPKAMGYLRKYSLDRLTRIWVVAIPALILSVCAAYLSQDLFGHSNSYSTEDCKPSLNDFLAAVFFLNKAFYPTICSNGPYWSIHNEMFYYFMWPAIVLAVFAKPRALRIGAAAVAVAMIGSLTLYDPLDSSNTLILFPVWIMGALCLFLPRLKGPIILYGAFVLAMMVYPQLVPGLGYWILDSFLLAVAMSLFFRRCVDAVPPDARLVRIARYFADISFSLYLTHVILLNFIVTWLRDAPGENPFPGLTAPGLATWTAYVLAAIGFAHIFYWLFESRTKTVRAFFTSRPQKAEAVG